VSSSAGTHEQLCTKCARARIHPQGHLLALRFHRFLLFQLTASQVHVQVKTVHRVIMSGTPIQNRLTELWSLFDYVFPGKLGTLPVFQSQFGVPIQAGTYSNASLVAVSAAYKCAVMLRDMISPYLLRRTKADVAKQLPKKSEQVLFCTLSPAQRTLYKAYLKSRDVEEILEGKRPCMEGITTLRKICNHADLLHRVELAANPAVDFGALERSSKLQVTMQVRSRVPVLGHDPSIVCSDTQWLPARRAAIAHVLVAFRGRCRRVHEQLGLQVLSKWREQGHKALLFTQTQQMLDIIERHARDAGMRYHRMDGSVALPHRFRMIDDFNNNPDIFVFLLTTRVGGLGVNLTGANRILLFDPDWNPSTDIQARERAWRLGQKKPVTIFRCACDGCDVCAQLRYHLLPGAQLRLSQIVSNVAFQATMEMKCHALHATIPSMLVRDAAG
jgi:DNA excision repair protein ERCC-6